MGRPGSLLALRDRTPTHGKGSGFPDATNQSGDMPVGGDRAQAIGAAIKGPPSRIGKKAITGYFSPDMSLAMHTAARRNGLSLQDAMADAFNDWLRKVGESPIGQ